MKWKDGLTSFSEQATSRKARASDRYQHQLILVSQLPCPRTMQYEPKPTSFRLWDWSDASRHMCVCDFAGGSGRVGTHSRALHPQSHLIPAWKYYMGFKCHMLPPSTSPAASSAWSHIHHRHPFQPNGKRLCGHDTPDGKCIGACAVRTVLCTAQVLLVSKPAQVRNKEQE